LREESGRSSGGSFWWFGNDVFRLQVLKGIALVTKLFPADTPEQNAQASDYTAPDEP